MFDTTPYTIKWHHPLWLWFFQTYKRLDFNNNVWIKYKKVFGKIYIIEMGELIEW